MMKFLSLIVFFPLILNSQTPSLTGVASGLNSPTDIESFKMGLLVSELSGTIQYMPNLTKDSLVNFGGLNNVSASEANGLFGITIHPGFPDSNFLFAHYTYDTSYFEVRVSRFDINADTLDPSSEKVILLYDNFAFNHQGGDLIFGQDGYLYTTRGDGERSSADPRINGQNPQNIKGSIVRIDPSRDDFPNDPNRNYGIPIDNPFIDSLEILDEIYAFGFRNPWRISQDPISQKIYVGDVGWNSYEEINEVIPGNYGWSCFEGPLMHSDTSCFMDDIENMIEPVFYADRSKFASITGGFVYRGSRIPSWQGEYFFADFELGTLCKLSADSTAFCWDGTNSEITGNFVSFGEDHNRELYLADFVLGDIYRIDTTQVECLDTLVVLATDNMQTKIAAIENITIQVDSLYNTQFLSKEFDVLSVTSIYDSSCFIIDEDFCETKKYGFQLKK